MDRREAKTVYEVSKMTSAPRQVLDSFMHAAVMTMFRDYISSFKEPELALSTFLDAWADNTINQKKMEIEAMISQQDSMADLYIGMALSDTEDLDTFVDETMALKEAMFESITADLKRDDGDDE